MGLLKTPRPSTYRQEDFARSAPTRKRKDGLNQLRSLATEIFSLNDLLFQRAGEIVKLRIKDADAIHLAAAETLGADVFLTCDDRLSRAALRSTNSIHGPVANPLDWSPETHNAADT